MKASPAMVGGFVLGGLTLAALAILFFGGMRLFTPTLQAVVFFPSSVAGLAVGAPVTFRGVQVGSVRKIALRLNVADRSSIIPTYIELDADRISWQDDAATGPKSTAEPGIPRLVQAGLRATLSTPSLVTGQLVIDLDFRPNTPVPPPGPALGLPEIPPVPSAFQDLKDKLTDLPLRELVDDMRTTLARIESVAEAVKGQVVPLSDSVRQTSDSARQIAEAAQETVRASTEAVKKISADASRTLGSIDQLAIDSRQQVLVNGRELQRVLASAEGTAKSAEMLMASLNGLAAPRSELRGNLEAALRDLADSASSLRNFSRELERNPVGALRGR